MQRREAVVHAAVGRINPERLLTLLDGLAEAVEANESGGAVAPTRSIVGAEGEGAVVEPEGPLEAALPVQVVPGPLDLLGVGGRHGAPEDRVVVGGGGHGAPAAGADDAPVAVVGGPGAEHVVAGGAGRRGRGGAGGGERFGEAAGGTDVARGERVGERRGGGAGARAGCEDEWAGACAAVARGRLGRERDLAGVAPARGEAGGGRERGPGDGAGGARGGARGRVVVPVLGGVRERGDGREPPRGQRVRLVGGGEEHRGGEGVREGVRHWRRRAVGHSAEHLRGAGGAGSRCAAGAGWRVGGRASAAWRCGQRMGVAGWGSREAEAEEGGGQGGSKE
jgi:hypothetical protein